MEELKPAEEKLWKNCDVDIALLVYFGNWVSEAGKHITTFW